MNNTLKKIIQREKFNPTVLGLFINHNFTIRRLLYKSLKKNAPLLSGKILDFGCGSKPYEHLFKNATEYIGVDYEIEGRTANLDKINFFYDGKTILFESNSFDAILSTEVLEHVFNIDELLSEFNRVLKPNGIALITTPFMWEEHEMPYDFARYTTPALLHIYKKHGFIVVSNSKNGNTIHVVFQFCLNYWKNIFPQNKVVRQLLLIPFTFLFNVLGSIFGFILPKDDKSYFNNVFLLRKI
jgi:2-polyprenyl-3-methyl-5-hydroxy-6-metoxy-1,4-benzoquinol methylase